MSAILKAGLRSATLLIFAALGTSALAQTESRVVVDVGTVVQSYSTDDDQAVDEVTVPLAASVSVIPGLELSLNAVYASVTGNDLESLSGLGDTQLGASFRRQVGGGLVDLSLLVNVPTGQTALTPEQFATSAALALDDYAFALPTLGRGAIVSPGLTIAVPVGEGLALGLGAAYSVSSPFTLFESDSSTYAPADETILTAGIDASLGGASTFTLEGSYVLYGDDEYRGEVFSPGNKVAGMMRLALGGGAVRGSFLARYREVEDGLAGTPARPVVYLRPSQAQAALGLSFVQSMVEVGLSSGLRYYGSISETADAIDSGAADIVSALADQQLLLDVGIAPVILVGANAMIRGSFTYTFGVAEAAGASPLTGYRAGGGLRIGF